MQKSEPGLRNMKTRHAGLPLRAFLPAFRIPVCAFVALLLAACSEPAPPPSPAAAVSSGTTATRSPQAQLHRLFDAAWQQRLRDDPTLATYLGDARFNDRWEDLSAGAIAARQAAERAALKQLETIDRRDLTPEDQLNYDLFRRDLEDRIEGQAYQPELMPISPLGGVQLSAQILDFMKFSTVRDYEDWLARLQAFGALVDQNIALMRRGMAAQRLRPEIAMRRVLPQVSAQIVARAQDSAYYAPFRAYPESVAPDVRAQLDLAAQAAVMEVVVPAFQRLRSFLEKDYLPACPRDAFGLSAQPRGAEFYAWRVRHYTGTRLSPEQVHDIGLAEVARLDTEMKNLMREAGHQGSALRFQEKLGWNPRYQYRDAAQLLDAYRAIAKRIDPELPRLFGRLPRTPYGVRAIPDIAAPAAPAAYYYPPSADGSRAGYFYANTYRPQTRPGWAMEALVAHEAVPGHHLQMALANELQGLPEFRRLGLDQSAYVEGWALYAESLGAGLGLYADTGSRFGRLSAEMWRAVRLVVDTGLHARGWSRRQAREYFAEHAPRAQDEIAVEVDRYLVDPGQALAYKIGELKIRELRKRAQDRLGERFGIRAFHDTVLGSGPLPLDLLEQNVNAWIEEQAKAGPRPAARP